MELRQTKLLPILLISAGSGFLGCSAPEAAERSPAAAPCVLVKGETGTVAAVLDGLTLRLDDGLVVRLAGIGLPEDTATAASIGGAARAELARLIEGRRAELRYGGERRDRYGRAVGHVFAEGAPGSVQEALLRGGLARVESLADNRACLGEMLGFERSARTARRGLWAQPALAPRRAGDPSLRGIDGLYELVEGRIESVGDRPRTVYLNFGAHWSDDFTVTVVRELVDKFADEGLMLAGLDGRRVRVRGWLRQKDGPWIVVDHPEQIEVLDDGDGIALDDQDR